MPKDDLCEKVVEQGKTIIDHETRIRDLEVKEAVLGTKLDTTNKLLLGIFTVITGACVTLIFELIKRGGIK